MTPDLDQLVSQERGETGGNLPVGRTGRRQQQVTLSLDWLLSQMGVAICQFTGGGRKLV